MKLKRSSSEYEHEYEQLPTHFRRLVICCFKLLWNIAWMMLSLCFPFQNVRCCSRFGEIVERKVAGVSLKIHLEFIFVGGWRHTQCTHVLNNSQDRDWLIPYTYLSVSVVVAQISCSKWILRQIQYQLLITKLTKTFPTFVHQFIIVRMSISYRCGCRSLIIYILALRSTMCFI